MRPRLGVSSVGVPAASWADHCRRIEAAGLDEISVSDHLVPGALPPMVALAAAAVATRRVGLSTLVLNNELRHPGVLANEAALVAELSGGRLTLGVGAGHAEAEHVAIGLPFPPAPERVERLRESVLALRQLLAGEELDTDGPAYRFTSHRAAPAPASPVPILVGGGGRRVLEVAAQHADVVGLTGFSSLGGRNRLTHFSADGLDERLAFVRAAAGERAGSLRFQALVQQVQVTDDREGAAASIAEEWASEGLDLGAVLECPFLLLGTVAEIAAQVQDRTARWGIETWTVFWGRPTDASLDELAAIATALEA
jgi:probable F420-dependent oxidoreductase